MENLGINISLKHYNKEELEKYAELIKEMGAGWARIEFDFYNIDSKLEYFDYLIEKLVDKNIKILGALQGVIPATLKNLIKTNKFFTNPLEDFDRYSQFVKNLCERYKNKINYWQIWNEQNTRRFWGKEANAEEYLELVKKTVPIIKEIDSNNKTVLGAICGNDVTFLWFGFKMFYFSKLIELGIENYIDIYSVQPYVATNYIGFNTTKNIYKGMINRIKTFIDNNIKYGKEIWVTEIGITHMTVLRQKRKEEDVAKIYTKILDYTLKRGLKTFLWVLTDFSENGTYSPFNPEPYFGLVNYNFEKKKTFEIIKGYIKEKW